MPAVTHNGIRLSVVIPIHNHFQYLYGCVQSVLDQRIGSTFEVILIDDCSTDPAVREWLRSIPSHPSVTILFNEKNFGISITQNKAVDIAKGEYVAFVDCDDFLAPDALSRAMQFIDDNSGCDYFFSDYTEVPTEGGPERLVHYGGYSDQRFVGDLRQDLINGMVAGHLKVIRRESLVKAGGFDPKFSGVQDWDLALKILEFGKFLYLPESLYFRRTHAETVTTSDMRGQIHLTNKVRRLYAASLLQPPKKQDPLVLSGRQKLDVLDVLAHWKSCSLILDTTGGLSMDNLWWTREFNSYFDQILWSSPQVYSSLLGYVWSPEVLKKVQL
jgi:glycosyltransferase involved in cell wall biosynthesis